MAGLRITPTCDVSPVVARAREARAAGRAARTAARQAGRRSLALRSASRRIRRQIVGPIYAMDADFDPPAGYYWARGVPAAPVDLAEDAGQALRHCLFLDLDEAGYITRCDGRAAEEVTGFEPAQLVGRHLSVLYDADAVANNQPQRDLSVALASDGCSERVWRQRRDGSRFWAAVVLIPRRCDGRVAGYTAIVRDLSPEPTAEDPAPRPGVSCGAPTDDPFFSSEVPSEVVARLFRAGLVLQAAHNLTSRPEALRRIDEAIETVDGTIRYIRNSAWRNRRAGDR